MNAPAGGSGEASSAMNHVRIETASDGIATITLDHANSSVNLVDADWIGEFTAAIGQLNGDPSVRGVIVASAKRTFMAGADLHALVGMAERGITSREAFAFSQTASRMHRLIETGGKPWVAAIAGAALGGGFELALACHRRIVADDPKAVVGLPEVKVGLLAGSGGTQRLLRLAGARAALDLMLTGRSLAPADALALGVIDEIVPAAELMECARTWLRSGPDPVRAWDRKGYRTPEHPGLINPDTAASFMNQTARVVADGNRNYPAPIAITACVFEGMQLPFDRALAVESKYFATLLAGPVAGNIIRTNFINKGAAEKLAGRPDGVPARRVGKVGVLGAGLMGGGLALVCAKAGLEVVLLDATLEKASAGREQGRRALSKDVARGRMTEAAVTALLDRITPTADYAALAGCELVIEAVFEDVEVKAEVTRQAERAIPDDAVFASNTSTLPIGDLARASVRPDRFIGLHFFSPVERMELVEVIMGARTSRETLAHALDFIAQLRKTPIVVNDSRGFYTSRVFQTFIHEGMAMLRDGVAPARIENGARSAGMPVGPLALLDEVSLELPMKIIRQGQAQSAPDGPNAYEPPCGLPVLEAMLAAGRSGRRGGGGFLDYPEGGRKHLWAGLGEMFPVAATQPTLDEVRDRLLLIQALETARCLEEGVLTEPADADLGAVLGWGFPGWTGGTLSIIDTIGIAPFVARCDELAERFGERFRPSAWLRARAGQGARFLPPVARAA